MTSKQLTVLLGAAVVLGGAALCLSSGSRPSGPALNGKAVFPGLAISEVARIELGGKLALSGGEGGWKVETYHNYPADHSKLAENLIKLSELKVGQVARGVKIDSPDVLSLKDSSGKVLASLPLGERHAKWGHGRYATFSGETVLVSDSLDAFCSDGKSWVETKIVDTPWISFSDIAEGVSEEELGFATGVVAKVTIAGDTNRVATIGNKVKDGSDRYFRLDNSDWVFVVPEYSVDKLLPKPPPEEKKDEAKEESKDEAKEESKDEANEGAEAKPEAEAGTEGESGPEAPAAAPAQGQAPAAAAPSEKEDESAEIEIPVE